MKFVRVSLLLLLIALVPLRGGLAAVLLFDGDTTHCQADAPSHVDADESQHFVPHEHVLASAVEKHHAQPGAADKCRLCSGLTTPACPVGGLAGLGRGLATVKVRPQPTVWPASFVSAGLERPPRST